MVTRRRTIVVLAALVVASWVAVGGLIGVGPAGHGQSGQRLSSNGETSYLAQGPGDPWDPDCWGPNGWNPACGQPDMMGPGPWGPGMMGPGPYGPGMMGPGMMGPQGWNY